MNKFISYTTAIWVIITGLFFGGSLPVVKAAEQEAGASATFGQYLVPAPDSRVRTLKLFLKQQNSPLSDEAWYFIWEADRLSLDWRLVAAIAGVESTFGKRIPQRSYNAWGWAVYTGKQSGANFQSWKHGITTVSEGLRYNYLDNGAQSLAAIGRRYAASTRWTGNVSHFMDKIATFTPKPKHIEPVL